VEVRRAFGRLVSQSFGCGQPVILDCALPVVAVIDGINPTGLLHSEDRHIQFR
jgi:hypothetical protein